MSNLSTFQLIESSSIPMGRYLLLAILCLLNNACNSQNDVSENFNYQLKNTNMLYDRMSNSEYNYAMTYYLNKAVEGETLSAILGKSNTNMIAFVESIPVTKISYKYGASKWTIGEVLQHIISYEYIMAERALVVAGKAPEELKHSHYTQSGTAKGGKEKTKTELLRDFKEVRQKTIELFETLSPEELKKIGTLDGNTASVRAIGLCISGHQVHHFNVIRDRYLAK